VLVALAPAVPIVEGGTTMTTLQGTWDLGAQWWAYPGVYPDADSGAWNPGDALRVSASGGEVAPFSGTLQTGALLSGVTPAIGTTPLVIDRTQDLQVSWTPEGRAGENVLLAVQQFTASGGLTCYCEAADPAGRVTVSATLLGQFDTQQPSGRIRVERLITSTAPCANATIDLVGEVSQTGDVSFR
jgi:hypothetical protein